MDYDSGSSCDERVKDLQGPEEIPDSNAGTSRENRAPSHWYNDTPTRSAQPVEVSKRLLSAQVLEYYNKMSRNSSLGRYFSLAEPNIHSDPTNYYQGVRCTIPDTGINIGESRQESYIILSAEDKTPRERRRWARPPLIGQHSSPEVVPSTAYAGLSCIVSRSPSPINKRRPTTDAIPEERSENRETRENLGDLSKEPEQKTISPTSSVASHKPLEWDSGADVGYYNSLPHSKEKNKKLCTIERMALARGCSAALRLDPEGTTSSAVATSTYKSLRMKPDANSTPLAVHVSGESECEIEITPIVKHHLPGIIIGSQVKEKEFSSEAGRAEVGKKTDETSNSKTITERAAPVQIKYPTEGFRASRGTKLVDVSSLKKSASMNLLAFPSSRLSLKRSQSELNLRAKEKKNVHGKLAPLIFNSTSSIATVVNKPATCDKIIQTNLETCCTESVGIQVSVELMEPVKDTNAPETNERNEVKETEEEKPPLPKRASSLAPSTSFPLHSILKNSQNTYDLRTTRKGDEADKNSKETSRRSRGGGAPVETGEPREGGKTQESFDSSRNDSRSSMRSLNPPAVEESTGENATGRASNSFEYFPGHVYENMPNGSTSQVSSIDTGRESRGSTMPNTSSSIDEKLWGDSDSLVRDLERSVNILKSLVDANKCDKQVKKRLIHHVIKRLVTAKYTDDRIDRDLEENVPWNPADARNKVYRNEIIQALANKHDDKTTDSSGEDWRPRKRNVNAKASSSSPKKINKDTRAIKEMIDLVASRSSASTTANSDKFAFDRHTDRTLMDGRKARMGLRSADRCRETNVLTDPSDKSETSDCFLPQSQIQQSYKIKSTNKSRVTAAGTSNATVPTATVTTIATTSTSATSTSSNQKNPIAERLVLVKERRSVTESNETDWRLPTTMSERRFEEERCSNSESGDTKLINYAEREKRNQLAWITNEISHLCNLKRLLQEPKKDEATKSSPRKLQRSVPIVEHPWIVLAPERGGNSMRNNLENVWSSHGNLVSARSEDCVRASGRVPPTTRKRNSCTQTGNEEGPSGHSKSGGEIISAMPIHMASTSRSSKRDSRVCSRDVEIQTFSPRMPRESGGSSPEQLNLRCQVHRHVCYCQRYAAHSRHTACIAHSPQRSMHDHQEKLKTCQCEHDGKPIKTHLVTNSQTVGNAKNGDSRKEAKNQLNATSKSKYAVRKLPEERAHCAGCLRNKTLNPGAIAMDDAQVGACSSDCNCGLKQCQRSGDREDEKVETEEEEEADTQCTCCNDETEEDTQNQGKIIQQTCKSCRTCGTVWPVRDGQNANRKCKCSQDYLKPVAYELKFESAPKEKPRIIKNKGAIKINKIVAKDLGKNTSKGTTSSANTHGECACDDNDNEDVDRGGDSEGQGEDKKERGREPIGTLKDFLATNRPEFLNNVDTRCRYLSELSQLRQLKTQKRKEFLAMTGTSAFTKTQRSARNSTGATAGGQRKVSDYEMKLRLRMRYLRLNEVRGKRRQREKEEESRRNHLMAKLFGQKLQEKVLKGQVDLSQSVSVISNV